MKTYMPVETMRIFFIFLSSPRAFASATNLDMAIGRPSWVILMTRNKVGNAIIYKPTPSSPIKRAMTIRLINPRTLVIKLATIKIKVPFINFDIFHIPAFSKKLTSYTINYMQ